MCDLSLVCATSSQRAVSLAGLAQTLGPLERGVSFLLPGGGFESTHMTVYDAIVLRLSEKRGGNTLPTKAIKTTAKFLAENVGLEDAQEFSFLDLPSIVDEAWEKIESEQAPDFVKRKVSRWVNNDPGEK